MNKKEYKLKSHKMLRDILNIFHEEFKGKSQEEILYYVFDIIPFVICANGDLLFGKNVKAIEKFIDGINKQSYLLIDTFLSDKDKENMIN